MPEFVCRHNDARESSSVLHYGHTVHLLQSLVDDTGPAHVSKASGSSVTITVAGLAPERFIFLNLVLLTVASISWDHQGTDSSEDILHNEYMTQEIVLLGEF